MFLDDGAELVFHVKQGGCLPRHLHRSVFVEYLPDIYPFKWILRSLGAVRPWSCTDEKASNALLNDMLPDPDSVCL